MGLIVGLVFGLGLFSIYLGVASPRPVTPRPRLRRLTDLAERAGKPQLKPRTLILQSAATGFVVFVVMLLLTSSVVLGVVFAAMASAVPTVVLTGRATKRQREHAELWPDAVDNLASAVRAGLSLPEALIQLGERGPEPLRPPFISFARDYQSIGRFDESLDRLKRRLGDPVGDRVVEALRIAREVGGGDLGGMLRRLSSYLRDDLRTRRELESRQSWTVGGARLAAAAPWIVLLLLSGQPQAVQRFSTATGVMVIGAGALVCLAAYRIMLRVGRLPRERRVMSS